MFQYIGPIWVFDLALTLSTKSSGSVYYIRTGLLNDYAILIYNSLFLSVWHHDEQLFIKRALACKRNVLYQHLLQP